VSFLLFRLLLNPIFFPILNQYSRLLHLGPLIITRTVAPPIREPAAAPLLGRAIMLLRCLGPPPEHLHLQEPFLLVLHEPLKLLPHPDLVAQLSRHLRVREKRGPHHFTRCCHWGILQVRLHHDFVVFEGACLQVGYVDFPSFGALSAGI